MQANPTAMTPVFGNIPDLIGRDFDEVIHRLWPREFADELVRQFRRTLETGESYGELEYGSRRIDTGGTEYYEWRIHRIPLPDGRFGVVCYFRDISAQVHVREEIERSEERFRAFVTATSDVIYQMSPDWSEMRQLVGRDIIPDTTDPSRSWLDRYIHPDDHQMVLRAIAEAIQNKTMFELEHRVIRVDGSLGWTYSRAVPRLRADGEVIEWFGTARDVSERKFAEEEIARLTAESEHQRRLYEAVVSSTPDLVYIFDRSHRFVFANDSLLKMWGKTREEAFGKNCLELGYEPWHAEMHDREIDEVLSSRRAVRGEVPFNGTGGRRIYDYIFVPVIGANGEVELVAGTTRDVTDRKTTEEELRRVNQDLEQFAYSASHDLKEPVRTVKIFSELLGERYQDKLDGNALDFLENIRAGAGRMEALVRDLLTYTQTSPGDKPSESTDAMAALETALANLKAALAESGGLVEADALPAVAVHATQLQSLFQNLVGNSLKYRRPGIAPVVRISARRQDGFWLFCVADNGIGIEPAFREQIFGLFKRLHTSDEYSGTGIGLAICKRIVEHYHGRIWVDSEDGEGCRFNFTLPG